MTELPKEFQKVIALGLIAASGLGLSGCGKGVPGIDQFHSDVLQGRLYVSFVAEALQWDAGFTMPVPGLEDATISIAPDLNSPGTVFQFSAGLESLMHNGKAYPLSGLPDGRSIPDVMGGMLPRWDFNLGSNLTLSLYLSNEAFGVFIPLKLASKSGFQLPAMVTVSIFDERGNLLGKAYAIPNVRGSGSGLFLLLPYLGGQPQPQPT